MRSLDSFLKLGLIGMARGGRHGWFYAHFGAAFLAGYFMDGLVHVLELTTQDRQNRYWGIDNYFEVTEPDVRPFVPPYRDTVDMAQRAFEELHTVSAGKNNNVYYIMVATKRRELLPCVVWILF
ncbi:hypothetical protein [Brevibacillus borstelensis]|uniref:hypothetical protein n=1 Tax=Brevibacillus borstelensis TaxID=45462 RepID=UPI001D0A2C74|nr:hypothetical protein [Brevibacillus borstelensis]MCC0567495.1 hypothetical protein [Brevibacillus borstelensis]